jgi:hypothetical protein
MAVRLSALRVSRALLPRNIYVLISVRDCVNPGAIVRLEGLCKLKKFNDITLHCIISL